MANTVAFINKIKAAAEDKGVTLCLELLNSKVNHKDYQCDRTAWGVEVCKRVNSPRVKLLYDIYHMQIMEGDIIRTIRENIQYIGHFHTAGNPGRHELDATQELQLPADRRGHRGHRLHRLPGPRVRPRGRPAEGPGRSRSYLRRLRGSLYCRWACCTWPSIFSNFCFCRSSSTRMMRALPLARTSSI